MIVIPMAGLSKRFTDAGYDKPKFMLEAHGRSLFDHAISSFARYFETEPFLFVARGGGGTGHFIASRCEALGLARWKTVLLDSPTRGQAETVALGVERAGADPANAISIFNIDTFRPGFEYPKFIDVADGYLETFEGEGANWSFVRPEAPGSDRVAQTTEKQPISRFCCTGLYHFARLSDFLDAYAGDKLLAPGALQAGELYVAPLYNRLIAAGLDIRFTVIPRDEVIFCGVPAEYESFLADPQRAPG
jgi:hypothetical protein